ncbi:hypothetical protein V5E97_05765 [Singulisphaera sp. Ch08]|uniref:Uncharacterized protein n=1 Tax=Singulisphaera sp. Ch08 TaxID=3120278 RepID=A0AAU7CJF2_9BACT
MEFPPRKRRGKLIRHAAIVLVAVLTLVTFRFADDEVTGKAEASDAYGFTLIFVVAGYYIGWLSEIWKRCKGKAFDPFVMPIFYMLVLLYLYLSFRSYFVQPGATGLTILVQLLVMICFICRVE